MLKELMIPADSLYYSVFSGWNRYHLTGGQYRWMNDVQYPEVQNLAAAERFHIRPLHGIFHPASQVFLTEHILPEGFIHPVDIAAKPETAAEYVCVYRNLPVSQLQSLGDFTEQRNVAEEPEDARRAQRFAHRILTDAAGFYHCGYAYYGWDADSVYSSVNGERLYYDECSGTGMAEPQHPFPAADKAKLYCDPFQVQYGEDLDYFGMIVLLFYVLIGRFPYDGRLMDGIGAATAREQAAWYDAYRKNCIFIFDPENSINSIGTFASEEKFRQRWALLPADVKAVFTEVFTGRRTGNKLTPAPDELLRRCAFFRGE